MRHKTMRFILVIFLLIIENVCTGQSFSIKEVGLPNGNSAEYIYNSNSIKVYRDTELEIKIEVQEKQKKSIDSAIVNLDIFNLESNYSTSTIDGYYIVFNFQLNDSKKEVVLNNYYMKKIDKFLQFINSFLPNKFQHINYSEHDIKSPDTLFNYLPDFALSVEYPDSNYTSFNILDWNKGYKVTDIHDTIDGLECRIYPSNINSKIIRRVYWKAEIVEDKNWEIKYYDTEGKIIYSEIVEIIFPYEFVKVDSYRDLGRKPEMIYKKYYKTNKKYKNYR